MAASRLRLKLMSRWATVSVALLLAFALGTSSLTDCMGEPALTAQAQMACCEKGHDECPMHRSASQTATDCCQHNSQRQHEFAAAEQTPVHVLVVNFAQVAMLASTAAVPDAPRATITACYFDSPTSPPTPRTVLSTVLLI